MRIAGLCLTMQLISFLWGGGGSIIFYSSEILRFVPNLFFKHNTESESFGHSFAKVLLKSTDMK